MFMFGKGIFLWAGGRVGIDPVAKQVRKIDKINQLRICKDGDKIHITDIIDISSPVFNKLDSYFQ